ncbi:OmpW/AlkL family protein [Endozoicomonas elysicola]|uniref:Membrane protein n=1 Tax=Endozoicomonas elysicola TaxID=305900 RepID=A0A081KBY2_9GAMM|nr:OmpW family outer membrane protein [Endozoicomonas elysicola]KEI71658.1 membrane protein [Endozoicomonas elysicola]
MKIKSLSLAIISATALLSGAAQAYEAGDFIVRAGLVSVNPDVDSGNLHAAGIEQADQKVDVNNDSQLGLSLTYMVQDNIGIELLAATPFSHNLQGKGGLSGLNDFAEVKHLPPTLTVQYYPMQNNSAFQPYVGLGLNYTIFFSEKFINGADAAFGSLELDDSLGLAAQAGFDYQITDNWSLNAAVWYMDIDTTGTFKNADGSGDYKIDVSLDPWVYMAGVAYRF